MITPARKWAPAEAEPNFEPVERIPVPQFLVMLAVAVVPFIGLIGAIFLFWGHGVGWLEVGLMIGMYCIAGYGTTIGFHRLLTHRAFETYQPLRAMWAIFGSMGVQGPVIRWCATHRRHHQTTDQEGDPHSPHLHGGGLKGLLAGLWHAHLGWCFQADPVGTSRSVKDLVDDRALNFIDRFFGLWVLLGLAIPTVIAGAYYGTWTGALSGFVWGGLVRIFTMHHVTWSVNSVCHVWGTRPYASKDESRNNPIVAMVALGEGWHNNHHAFPTSARQGLRWWEFDSSWIIIWVMSKVGLAWDVRVPSPDALNVKSRKVEG
jgi:stearoyl-CoA desaturase (delta-9 desaturase)